MAVTVEVSDRIRLKQIHNGMKTRCYSPRHTAYKHYGGRGICICEEWLGDNGFENFCRWAVTHGYSKDLTIDRIDNDGNYEPGNCRWATRSVQVHNRRTKSVLLDGEIVIDGVVKPLREWIKFYKMPTTLVYSRIYNGWDAYEALTTKKKGKGYFDNMYLNFNEKEINENA